MSKISATIVADSINQQGDRITTMLITFPRFILAELNTHRMLSKNSASSRAIPFNKMVESVQNNPFIPIAWQKEHRGMQGDEYITEKNQIKSKNNCWLEARNNAIRSAKFLNSNLVVHDVNGKDFISFNQVNEDSLENLTAKKRLEETGVTKQLCNRLLEPFMWHTVLITATEWENFFNLRCPQYKFNNKVFRSKKDSLVEIEKVLGESDFNNTNDYLQWATINEGQAEIHMMALAEAMWDAMNESKPKQLLPGEWHIPFEDKIILTPTIPIDEGYTLEEGVTMRKVKISTAMNARTSYTVVGEEKEFTTEQQIGLHDRMANQVPFHASPFEHPARAMTNDEHHYYIKGFMRENWGNGTLQNFSGDFDRGWCRNYRGFIQYREILEHDKN